MTFCLGAQTSMMQREGNIAEVVLLLRVELLGKWERPA